MQRHEDQNSNAFHMIDDSDCFRETGDSLVLYQEMKSNLVFQKFPRLPQDGLT